MDNIRPLDLSRQLYCLGLKEPMVLTKISQHFPQAQTKLFFQVVAAEIYDHKQLTLDLDRELQL